MEDIKDFLQFMTLSCLGAFLFVGGVAYVGELSLYISAEASIEQLRSDINKVEGVVSEDIAGQVTQWNQEIRKKQRWNDIPIISIVVPNGWDQIQILEIDTGR